MSTVTRAFLFAVLVAFTAVLHVVIYDETDSLARWLAPKEPKPLDDKSVLAQLRGKASYLDGLSDKEALKRINSEPLPPHPFGFDGLWALKQDKFDVLVSHTRMTPVYRHQQEHLEPMERRIEMVALVVFPFLYLVFAWFALTTSVRWLQTKGVPSARAMMERTKLGPSGWRLRRREKEFFRLKTLFENGLLTEQEFARRKLEFRSDIEKSGLAN